jgi:hypothetical protein
MPAMMFLLIVLAFGLGFDWQNQSADQIRQHDAKAGPDGKPEPKHRSHLK